MATLISADLDRSRAEVTLIIELSPASSPDTDDAVMMQPLVYSTDQRGRGDAPANETAQAYRTRLKDWLKTVRSEARLMADHEAQKRGITAAPSRDDVLADIAPAFV